MNKHEYSIEDVHLSHKRSINKMCNQLLLRVTFVCFIFAIIFGYSFMLARNSTLFGNVQDFDVRFVTNSSRFGMHVFLHQNLFVEIKNFLNDLHFRHKGHKTAKIYYQHFY